MRQKLSGHRCVSFLKGSYTASSDNKYQEYIFEGKTIKSIVFQSRNAAAQFVLGDTGQTKCWKIAR